MSQFTIDISGSYGLNKQTGAFPYKSDYSDNLRYVTDKNSVINGVYNPHRYEGYLAPAISNQIYLEIDEQNFNYDLAPSFTGLLKPITITNSQLKRWVINGSNLFELNLGSHGVSVIDSEITSNITDIIFYSKHFYYIYRNNIHRQTDTEISSDGIKPNNWMTNIAVNTSELTEVSNNAKFVEGNNNLLYVLDNNSIHTIDSSVAVSEDGRIDAETLTFPEYVHLIDGVDFKNKLYISYSENNTVDSINSADTYKSPSRLGVFVWNKQSIVGTQSDIIFIEGANAITEIFQDGFNVYAATVSSSGVTQIRRYTGSNFQVIWEFSAPRSGTKDQKISNKLAIKTTEQGTIIVTNYGEVYLMSLGGDYLYKINNVDTIAGQTYEGFEITKGNNNIGEAIDLAYKNVSSTTTAIALYNDNVKISDDGFATYTTVSITSGNYTAITYDETNDTFVIVGPSTSIYSDDDGATWTSTSIDSENWNDVEYGDTNVVAVGDGGSINISDDGGATWTAADYSTINITSVEYSATEELWLIGTDNGDLYSSSDLSSWTSVLDGSTITLKSTYYYGGLYYTLTYNSSTGASIVSSTSDFETYEELNSFSSVEYDDLTIGDDVIVVYRGATGYHYSDDLGLTWNSDTLNHAPNKIRWCDSVFISVSDGGYINTSPDGVTWTTKTSGTTNDLVDVTYSGDGTTDGYIVVADSGTNPHRPFYSSDLNTWADQVVTGTDASAMVNTGVASGNGIAIISESNGTLFCYSLDDGDTWVNPFDEATAYYGSSSNYKMLWKDGSQSISLAVYDGKSFIPMIQTDTDFDDTYLVTSLNKVKYNKKFYMFRQGNNPSHAHATYANGLIFVSQNEDNLYYSSDDFESSARLDTPTSDYEFSSKIVYGLGYYVISTSRSTSTASQRGRVGILAEGDVFDGANFTAKKIDNTPTSGASPSIGANNISDVAFDGTYFIGVNTNGVHQFTPTGSATKVSGISFSKVWGANGIFFGYVSSSDIRKSTDHGDNWSSVTTPFNVGWIEYDQTAELWVISESNGDSFAYSTDGSSWTTVTSPITWSTFRFAIDNGYLVAMTTTNETDDSLLFCYDIYASSPKWRRPANPPVSNYSTVSYNPNEQLFVFTEYHPYADELDIVSVDANVSDIENYFYNVITYSDITSNISTVDSNSGGTLISTGGNTPNGIHIKEFSNDDLDEREIELYNISITPGRVFDIEYSDTTGTWYVVGNTSSVVSTDSTSWTKLAGSTGQYNSVNAIDSKSLIMFPSDNYVAYTTDGTLFKYFYPEVPANTYGNAYHDLSTDDIILLSDNYTFSIDGVKTISPEFDYIDNTKDIVIEYAGYINDYTDEAGEIRVGTPSLFIGMEVIDKNNLNGIRFIKIPINYYGTLLGNTNNVNLASFELDLYPLQGDVKTGVQLLPKRSELRNIMVYCKPTADTGAEVIGYIDVYINQSATAIHTETITRSIANKGYIDIELNRHNVNAVQLGVRWNTAHQTGDNDMLLSQAVVTYDPIYSSR